MILPCKFFTNRALHQPRQRRQDVDRRIYLTIVQLSVNKNLSLRDVSGQIRNGMSDIYKNRQLASDTFLNVNPTWGTHRHSALSGWGFV